MIFSSFSAWQILSAEGKIKIGFDNYINRLGLVKKKEKISKDILKEEERIAMENVKRIVEKAKNG